MDPQAVASRYRNETIENAPPVKIVRLMYQGALRFLDQAAELDAEAEAIHFREKVNRAGDIVTELRVSLDHEKAPELAAQLDRLYDFVEDRLFAAATELTADPIPEARRVLGTLYSAWKEIGVPEQHEQQ